MAIHGTSESLLQVHGVQIVMLYYSVVCLLAFKYVPSSTCKLESSNVIMISSRKIRHSIAELFKV